MNTLEKEVEVIEGDVLVSMTDVKGKITYVNDIFCQTAGYTREEILGKPHNIVRHPDMPKVIFKVLWDALLDGKSVSAFVKNKVNGGGFYWVRAFVAPVMVNGTMSHIISYRRRIEDSQKEVLSSLYGTLVDYERRHSVKESYQFFMDFLDERKLNYREFLNRISENKQVTNVDALNIDLTHAKVDHLILSINIQERVKRGEKNFEVTKPCCCKVGKWIESLSGTSMSHSREWRDFVSFHSVFHNSMQLYANGQTSILAQAKEDELKIYESLQKVIDITK